ncbi:PEP-CTERM sorting domain-containing protein [Sphingobium sp. AP49]|uniref:PEP-CTERM sorting domain-containing protein n=1 Tax=Sphingobium sp. AP49 TaxID=1144307 RepID=UPI00026ED575|nr:PEP-CTERM sorting domain-containing protein [Sphingobium sp. AP49]WHO38651.1 PEP-CTERM sorting domain-containing protein [Sphingobium sp. AP49]
MKINKLLLLAGVAGFIGAATPAQATWCWFGKCGSTSSGGTPSSTGGTPSSSGGATPVPEPEQMALFGMGAAVLASRVFFARRKQK